MKPSTDQITTILGGIVSTIVITKIDWPLLMHGDMQQIATLLGAIAYGVKSYYTKGIDASGK